MLVQAENFRKKFRSLPIPHLRVPLKHATPLLSSHFGTFCEEREHLLGITEADRAFVTICHPPPHCVRLTCQHRHGLAHAV